MNGTPIYDENSNFVAGIICCRDITKQVENEKRIFAQNETLRVQANLLNLSNEAIFVRTLNGSIIYWNKGAENLYGYSFEDAVGRISQELLKTVYPSNVKDINTTLARDLVWSGEIIHTTHDGIELIIETNQQVISDESGHMIILETNRDITERKQLEDELQRSEMKLRLAAEASNSAAYTYDFGTGQEQWSNKFEDLCGIAADKHELLYKCLHPDDMLVVLEKMTAASDPLGDGVLDIDFRIFLPNGSVRWLHARGQTYFEGEGEQRKPSIAAGSAIDITERKELELELQRAFRYNVEILESISDGFFSLDKEWCIKYVNKRAAHNVGYEPKDLINNNFWDTFKALNGTDLEKNFRKSMSERTAVHFDLPSVLSDSHYQYNVYPINDGISVYWLDITSKKLAEEKIKRQNEILNAINLIYVKAINSKTVVELGQACLAIIETSTSSKISFINEVDSAGTLRDVAISYPGCTSHRMNDLSGCLGLPGGFPPQGLCGSVITTGQSLLTNAPSHHPNSTGLPKGHHPLTAFLGVPVIQNGKVVGSIGVGNREGGYSRDDQDFVEAIAPTILEVLLRKRAEEHQRAADERYRILYDSTHQGVIYFNADGTIISMNPAAERILGRIIDEFSGDSTALTDFDCIWADGSPVPSLERPSMISFRTGLAVEDVTMGVFIPRDNAYRWIKVNTVPVFLPGEAKPIHVYAMFNDITKQTAYEKELKYQYALRDSAFENIPDAIGVYNTDGKAILLNTRAQAFFPSSIIDLSNGLFQNYNILDFNGNEISTDNFPIICAFRGEIIENKIMVVRSADREFVYTVSSVPIRDENNNIVSAIVIAHNISESIQKQRLIDKHQEQMLEAEKEKNEILNSSLKSKDEFISLISHEFRTPLTVINTAVGAMETICKNELSERGKNYLRKIQKSTYRQMKLVNNLLDITRVNSGRLDVKTKNIDILAFTKAITEEVKSYSDQKAINLTFSSTLLKNMICIDEEKYERILVNLLSNAVKYSPNGHSISVKLSEKTEDNQRKLYLKVKDSGIGIPEDKQEMIFEKFGRVDNFTTRMAEGSGIGLYLVKMLVELMGGQISVKSSVNIGSTFTVVLPDMEALAVDEEVITNLTDDRIIRSANIEFSDIYF